MRERRDDLSKAASHADRPRNSVTTTPSSPVMSARTRLAGTPESMRAWRKCAPRNSDSWRCGGVNPPSARTLNRLDFRARSNAG